MTTCKYSDRSGCSISSKRGFLRFVIWGLWKNLFVAILAYNNNPAWHGVYLHLGCPRQKWDGLFATLKKVNQFPRCVCSMVCSKPFQALLWGLSALPVQFGLSDIGSDLSIVLDNSRKSDDVNFWISGFEVLPQVLRWQNLTGLVDPHVPEHAGTGCYIIWKHNQGQHLFWLCLPVQVALLLPGCLDALLCIIHEVGVAGFGELVYFLQEASKRPSTVIEVPLLRSHIGSRAWSPLIWELATAVSVVTCRHRGGTNVAHTDTLPGQVGPSGPVGSIQRKTCSHFKANISI